MFLLVLFSIKTGFTFKNPFSSGENKQVNGLVYNNTTIGDLVNKSTTGDGIPDWEKTLFGLDPTKKENVPGVPDSVTIEKLIAQNQAEQGGGVSATPNSQSDKNLTKTDQFSRDLFATVAAADQNGQPMDQTTIDQISNSLADQIQNSAPRKVWTLFDINIIKDDSVKAVQKYSDALNSLFQKNPVKYTVIDVLQKFIASGDTPDASALAQLDPIIKATNNIMSGMLKMETPQSLATLHLSVINNFEKISENLNDIKLYDTDSVVALSGMSGYDQNATALISSITTLTNTISQRLKPQ